MEQETSGNQLPIRPAWVTGDPFLEKLWDAALDSAQSKQCYRRWGLTGTLEVLVRVLDGSGIELTDFNAQTVRGSGLIDARIGAWGRRKITKSELNLKCARAMVSFAGSSPFKWIELMRDRSKVKKVAVPVQFSFNVVSRGTSAIIPDYPSKDTQRLQPVYCNVDENPISASGPGALGGDVSHVTIGKAGEVRIDMSDDNSKHQHLNVGVNNGTISQTIAKDIKDSFNSANSVKEAQLKSSLAKLHKLVEAFVIDSRPADAAREDAAHNLKMLASEAARGDKANKNILKVSGEGLVSAAKTVVALAAPIFESVKLILSFFGVSMP